MRLLGALGLVAPVVLIFVFIVMPSAAASWVDDGLRSIAAAIAAGAVGVSLTALLVASYAQVRLRQIIKAAERLAQGELGVSLRAPERHGGPEGRLARALNAISTSLASTTDAATVDKLTGVSNRQALLESLFNECERANRYG